MSAPDCGVVSAAVTRLNNGAAQQHDNHIGTKQQFGLNILRGLNLSLDAFGLLRCA
jgi:hypothetical protein